MFDSEQIVRFIRARLRDMPDDNDLTQAELAALAAIDGTTAKSSRIPAAIKARLSELRLVERREWPDGPLWRTPKGNRRLKATK
jgi:hypothetical protein